VDEGTLPTVDELAALHFRVAARLAVLERKEKDYEALFQALMSAKHGRDFVQVRPAGSVGDRKCDGYLRASDTVFQSYAPRELKNATTAQKIREDFEGGRAQWPTMRGWTFVHNDERGLPPDAAQALLDVAAANPAVDVAVWGPGEVRALSDGLELEQLTDLFGPPPRKEDLLALGYADIAPVVRAVALDLAGSADGSPSGRAVDPRKLEHNRFGDASELMLRLGLTGAGAVEAYFADQPDALLRDRIAGAMADRYAVLRGRGLSPDAILHKLLDPLTAHATTTRETSASYAVVAHLFETCDIFENPPARATAST